MEKSSKFMHHGSDLLIDLRLSEDEGLSADGMKKYVNLTVLTLFFLGGAFSRYQRMMRQFFFNSSTNSENMHPPSFDLNLARTADAVTSAVGGALCLDVITDRISYDTYLNVIGILNLNDNGIFVQKDYILYRFLSFSDA